MSFFPCTAGCCQIRHHGLALGEGTEGRFLPQSCPLHHTAPRWCLAHSQGFLCQAKFALAWSPALCYMAAVAQVRAQCVCTQEGRGGGHRTQQESAFLGSCILGKNSVFRLQRDADSRLYLGKSLYFLQPL